MCSDEVEWNKVTMTHHSTATFDSTNLFLTTPASAAVPKTGRQMELLHAECLHVGIYRQSSTFGLSIFIFSLFVVVVKL